MKAVGAAPGARQMVLFVGGFMLRAGHWVTMVTTNLYIVRQSLGKEPYVPGYH